MQQFRSRLQKSQKNLTWRNYFLFLLLCLGGVVWIFRTGYKLKA